MPLRSEDATSQREGHVATRTFRRMPFSDRGTEPSFKRRADCNLTGEDQLRVASHDLSATTCQPPLEGQLPLEVSTTHNIMPRPALMGPSDIGPSDTEMTDMEMTGIGMTEGITVREGRGRFSASRAVRKAAVTAANSPPANRPESRAAVRGQGERASCDRRPTCGHFAFVLAYISSAVFVHSRAARPSCFSIFRSRIHAIGRVLFSCACTASPRQPLTLPFRGWRPVPSRAPSIASRRRRTVLLGLRRPEGALPLSEGACRFSPRRSPCTEPGVFADQGLRRRGAMVCLPSSLVTGDRR
jgi:hypothetical protein